MLQRGEEIINKLLLCGCHDQEEIQQNSKLHEMCIKNSVLKIERDSERIMSSFKSHFQGGKEFHIGEQQLEAIKQRQTIRNETTAGSDPFISCTLHVHSRSFRSCLCTNECETLMNCNSTKIKKCPSGFLPRNSSILQMCMCMYQPTPCICTSTIMVLTEYNAS